MVRHTFMFEVEDFFIYKHERDQFYMNCISSSHGYMRCFVCDLVPFVQFKKT